MYDSMFVCVCVWRMLASRMRACVRSLTSQWTVFVLRECTTSALFASSC